MGGLSKFKFLSGGGEMGDRIHSFDWDNTALGAIDHWPQSLKTSVGIMLNAQHPIWIGWGPEVTFLYNDAYIQVLSMAKHPTALGKPASEVWIEIWDICGPLAEKVFSKGESSFLNDVRLFMNRGDYLEETFYSFSYTPIRDELGNVGGLFCPSTEVSAKILNSRRLRVVSELGTASLKEQTTSGACAAAASILAKAFDDIPFFMIYLVDPGGKAALLEQAIRVPKEQHLICPEEITLGNPDNSTIWPVANVIHTSQTQVVPLLNWEGFPSGAANQRLREALLLPIISRGQERPLGVIIAGVNPARKLDREYETFYELVAAHLATAILNARAAEEEKRRADKLAELDRAKTIFFTNVSHELRTPLTLILGPLEDGIQASANPPSWLKLAHSNSLRLLKLVNTLLDFSRLEANRVEPAFEPTDLAEFTSELTSVFRSGIERSGLLLRIDCPPLQEPVYVDREMWEKIVFNLLSNALKFTLQGEISVALFAQEDPSRVTLTVKDTGIGISQNELPRIFERFSRVKTEGARSYEGTGIGLALVKELVDLHGGQVGVESVEGKGTQFTVSLPRGLEHLPEKRIGTPYKLAAVSPGASLFIEETQRWLPESISPAVPSIETPDEQPETTGNSTESRKFRGKIVLADDNNDMRGYVQRLLLDHGFEVLAVPDGQAALEAVLDQTPALVLSDVMMPRLDGFGLLRKLRENEYTKSIPVILLSARAGEEARVVGVEAGADDYLSKPFSARELIARVTTHIELARVRKEAHDLVLQREEQLQTILKSITDGLAVLDQNWRFTFFSDQAARMINMSPEQLLGQCIWDLFPETKNTGFYERYHHAVESGEAVHFEEYYPEPLNKWFECHCYPSDAGLSVYFHEVTERKQAEQALAASEERLRAIYDGTHEYIGLINPEGILIEANKASLSFADCQREDVVGLPFWKTIWFRFTPGAPEVIHEAVTKAAGGEFIHFESTIITPAGEEKIFEISLDPIHDADGNIVLIVTEGRDITEKKLAENALREAHRQLEDRARHLDTLVQQRTKKLTETIGDLEAFSYSIAHDMRAPLRSLQGYSNILLSDYEDKLEVEGKSYLKRIAFSANRMDKLIQDVLSYSRIVRNESSLEKVDIKQLLHGILDTYPMLNSNSATIHLQEPLPVVLGNEAMLMQVFSNLLGNAVKFVPNEVKPEIKIWAESQGHLVKLFVQDNGIGIAPDQHEKIFEIFQQVEKRYEGTGIGLAIVRKAMERLGGKIGLKSELGKGSTFWIELRKADLQAQPVFALD